jgi:two-component system chemotaxis response regulator CheB
MNPTDQKAIRVLVVEDSQVIAAFLTEVLNSDPAVQVVGVAFDGNEALEAVQRTKPDVVTMDIHMPRVNCFEATRRIMETCPTPIVVVSGSSSSNEVATNFHAIEAGALAVVARPNGIGHPNHSATARELVSTVKLMSEVKVVKRWPRSRVPPQPRFIPQPGVKQAPGEIKAVVIGASTGGPLALQTILKGLPKGFAVPVLIVQHIAPGFVGGFVEWLSKASGYPIAVATHGEPLLSGRAYVAPDGFHMGISAEHRILLAKDVPENGMRPAVSFLFRSAEAVFGSSVIGVLLSGMGQDGAVELKGLKDTGAITIVQDEESSVVHGMPGEAIKLGGAIHMLPPESIAKTLTTIVTPL